MDQRRLYTSATRRRPLRQARDPQSPSRDVYYDGVDTRYRKPTPAPRFAQRDRYESTNDGPELSQGQFQTSTSMLEEKIDALSEIIAEHDEEFQRQDKRIEMQDKRIKMQEERIQRYEERLADKRYMDLQESVGQLNNNLMTQQKDAHQDNQDILGVLKRYMNKGETSSPKTSFR